MTLFLQLTRKILFPNNNHHHEVIVILISLFALKIGNQKALHKNVTIPPDCLKTETWMSGTQPSSWWCSLAFPRFCIVSLACTNRRKLLCYDYVNVHYAIRNSTGSSEQTWTLQWSGLYTYSQNTNPFFSFWLFCFWLKSSTDSQNYASLWSDTFVKKKSRTVFSNISFDLQPKCIEDGK